MSGKRIVPIGSMWTAGLSEIRPCSRPVSSPKRSEVQACAASWNESEKSSATNHRMISVMGMVKREFKLDKTRLLTLSRWSLDGSQ